MNQDIASHPRWDVHILPSLLLLVAALLLFAGMTTLGQPLLILSAAGFAISVLWSNYFKTYAFSIWVIVFVLSAFFYPHTFQNWGDFSTKKLITPLIQIIMLGMGITLSIDDFARVFRVPKTILIGMLLQFTIMPLGGWLIARAVGLPPEVAAGLILVGSCPGGVASNVITYLSRGDVALSVTLTACSTLLSPIMTPLAMSLLAGELVEVNVWELVYSILWMVILPVALGLIGNSLLKALNWRQAWVDRLMGWIAMAAICLILAIIIAPVREQLLKVGPLLILAAVLHNAIGYLLGYCGAWGFGLDEATRRTMAIEVGLQNSGMASGLALEVLKSPMAALAPAIFGPWMNLSGSMLASYWRGKPVSPPISPEKPLESADLP